jgi:ankyrin repeat protein
VENPNALDIDGEGPLHAAARGGHVHVVEVLIAHGADPRVKALYGSTALHVAVERSQLATARVLLKSGSDVNARDVFGRTPLHQAALQGDRELVALLLDQGADPAAVYAARTPAQLAARAGNEALAKWLEAYRPSAEAKSGGGATPRDEARPRNYEPLPRMPAKPGPRKPGSPVG